MDRVTESKSCHFRWGRATDGSSVLGVHGVWSRINKEFHEWSTGRCGSQRRKDW